VVRDQPSRLASGAIAACKADLSHDGLSSRIR
jgi:hypothetical protein